MMDRERSGKLLCTFHYNKVTLDIFFQLPWTWGPDCEITHSFPVILPTILLIQQSLQYYTRSTAFLLHTARGALCMGDIWLAGGQFALHPWPSIKSSALCLGYIHDTLGVISRLLRLHVMHFALSRGHFRNVRGLNFVLDYSEVQSNSIMDTSK